MAEPVGGHLGTPRDSERPALGSSKMAKRVSTVWMVHALTGQQGVKGELALEDDAVVFRPAVPGVGAHVFRFDQIKKARRAWASPVIELQLQIPQGLPVVGFYFIPPPSLEPPPTARFSFKRRARRRAVAELSQGNAEKRQEVDRWHELIRQAVEA
jgi:hypothetical protein